MKPPTHIGLAGRKALFARLLAYESRERNAPDDYTGPTTRVVAEMIDSGNQAMLGQARTPHLDDWLRNEVQKARTITEASWGIQRGTRADVMLQELEANAGAVSCNVCSGGRACLGNARDHRIVAAGGQCVRHILDAFADAQRIADQYYRSYARCFVSPPRLTLWTSEAAAKPHDIPIAIYVGAETRFEDDRAGPASAVELKVALRQLDWGSWLAVLYLFLHELVCHAYAGTAPPHAGRGELQSFDPFAEGWMDRVCGMILQDLAIGLLPAKSLVGSHRDRH